MIEKLKALWQKDRAVILYLIFGGLTTVVDWLVSFVLYYLLDGAIQQNALFIQVADVTAWVCAVTFAYVTNRKWVFESKKKGLLPIAAELGSFAGGRVVTFLIQEGIIFVCCNLLSLNVYAVKIAASVIVVILNYFISKLLVFRKK